MKNIYKIEYDLYRNGKYDRRLGLLYVSDNINPDKRKAFREDLKDEYPIESGYSIIFVGERIVDKIN